MKITPTLAATGAAIALGVGIALSGGGSPSAPPPALPTYPGCTKDCGREEPGCCETKLTPRITVIASPTRLGQPPPQATLPPVQIPASATALATMTRQPTPTNAPSLTPRPTATLPYELTPTPTSEVGACSNAFSLSPSQPRPGTTVVVRYTSATALANPAMTTNPANGAITFISVSHPGANYIYTFWWTPANSSSTTLNVSSNGLPVASCGIQAPTATHTPVGPFEAPATWTPFPTVTFPAFVTSTPKPTRTPAPSIITPIATDTLTPCDARFKFAGTPTAGQDVIVTFTDPTGFANVNMTGIPTNGTFTFVSVVDNGNGTFTWTYRWRPATSGQTAIKFTGNPGLNVSCGVVVGAT